MTSISRFNTVGLNNIKPAAPAQEILKTGSEETIRGNVPVNGTTIEMTTLSTKYIYEKNLDGGWDLVSKREIRDGKKDVFKYYYAETKEDSYYRHYDADTDTWTSYTLDGDPIL